MRSGTCSWLLVLLFPSLCSIASFPYPYLEPQPECALAAYLNYVRDQIVQIQEDAQKLGDTVDAFGRTNRGDRAKLKGEYRRLTENLGEAYRSVQKKHFPEGTDPSLQKALELEAHDLLDWITAASLAAAEVRSKLQSLQRKTRTPLDVKSGLDAIRASLAHAVELIEIILIGLTPEITQGKEEAAAVLSLFPELQKLASRFKPTEISFTLPETSPPILARPLRFIQVAHNLIKNAIESSRGKPVRVVCYLRPMKTNQPADEGFFRTSDLGFTADLYFVLEVVDQGPGFLEREAKEAYDGENFSTKGLGRVRGLTQVQRIVKSFMGFIEIDSDLGVGTTTRVYWHTLARKLPTSP